MARILICGGTGGIGSHLCEHLAHRGMEPALLSRSGPKADSRFQTFLCDPAKGLFQVEALKGCEFLINLAGAGIADKRWTKERKRALYESRVGTTQFLLQQVKKHKPHLKAYISASATGYYGQQTQPGKVFKESDPAGSDFVGQLCEKWEEASLGFEKLGIRTVRMRIGIVMMQGSGALEKMASPVKMGIGAPLGSGKQFIPWIHIQDLVSIVDNAMSNELYSGAINCCAPEPVNNKDFTYALGRVLNKYILPIPVPGFVLQLALGERAALVLEGSRVHPEKLLEAGFQFKFPKLDGALEDILLG